jgi:uncharacterized membrane protein
MTQLGMIEDAIAKLEATVEDTNAPVPDEIKTAAAKPQPTRSAPKATAPAKPNSSRPKTKPTRSKTPRSKKAILQSLVERKSGATMTAMQEATRWQAHSVRAGLTGLRKAGVDLERRTNRRGETVYAVAHT